MDQYQSCGKLLATFSAIGPYKFSLKTRHQGIGARLMGRMSTQRSKNGSEKVLGGVLGKGSQKGSEKGAFFCGFYSGSEKGSQKGF